MEDRQRQTSTWLTVQLAEELHRVLPVITEIVARWPATRVSVDTVKSEVAARAIDAGASVVNDVSALRLDQRIASVCAASGSDLVLMHSRGDVSDMGRYDHATYEDSDLVRAVISELRCAAQIAIDAGVERVRIVLDPGLGFAKRAAQSVLVLANLPRLLDLGFDVMVGASRKRFIGELTGVQQPAERVAGTIGANVAALMLGATWFRVHDVRANRAALDVAAAILEARA